jgi:16S rRNA (cytidine1402-2'-O)-methyltransferase
MPSSPSAPPRDGVPGLPPGLWIVATPLGNLSDVSERAKLALAHADRILCEDTRRTAHLLQALGIPAPCLERADAYSAKDRLREISQWLLAGENLALVTDAGTPAVSDPGSEIVALAHELGVRVTPVPGPSAVTTLLSVSGFGQTAFCFRGYFPRKSSEREQEVQATLEVSVKTGTRVHVWFESPQRILETFESISKALVEKLGSRASEARICLAKELTKSHEKIWSGNPDEVLGKLRDHLGSEGEKGEWCFAVLFPESAGNSDASDDSSDWVKALHCLLDDKADSSSITASEAARRVSQIFGVGKKLVYEKALRISGKKT